MLAQSHISRSIFPTNDVIGEKLCKNDINSLIKGRKIKEQQTNYVKKLEKVKTKNFRTQA